MILALILAAAATTAPKKPADKPAQEVKAERKPANRVLTLTDELLRTTVPELRVAPGTPTTLIFPVNIDRKKVMLADPAGLFYPYIVQGNTTVLLAKAEVPATASVPLSVGLEDGTLIAFVLRQAAEQIDLNVTVELNLTKASAPESVEALKQTINQLQARLDEYQSNSATSALANVATLVLAREPGTAVARTFEQHRVHARDKQSRLLVEAHHLYRLFDHSYLLLTVENRDPSRVWVLDRAEVRLVGAETTSIKVPYVESDLKSVPSEETAKVVVVFETLPQSLGQKISVTLFEKGGSRHVTLELEP